jgi:hypothetical protein
MNTQKPRQARVCECGAQFLTSAKFGNEEKCADCYRAKREAFGRAFAQLDADQRREILDFVQAALFALDEVPDARQAHCDATFREIMQGVQL